MKKFFLLALCMTWALVINVQAAFVPTAGVYYTITENNAPTLAIDTVHIVSATTPVQPGVKTITAGRNTQAIRFIPVAGLADTYYMENASGIFLSRANFGGSSSMGRTYLYDLNAQWHIVGTAATSIQFQCLALGTTPTSASYLAPNAHTPAVSRDPLKISNASTIANNIFTLTALDASTLTPAILAPTYPGTTASDTIVFNPPVSGTTLSTTFTVSGVNLSAPVTLSATGITFSPSSVPAGTVTNVTATATAPLANGSITLTSGSTTNTVAYVVGPQVGKWYPWQEINSAVTLSVDSLTATTVGLATINATSATQAFTFIPVPGKSGVYNIQNGHGRYLADNYSTGNFSFPTVLDATNSGTNTEFLMSTGNYTTGFHLLANSGTGYIGGVTAAGALVSNKASTYTVFKLAPEVTAVVINYVDASGNKLKPSRLVFGQTGTYTTTGTADEAGFVSPYTGLTYVYDATSVDNVAVAATGNSIITLKFKSSASIVASVSALTLNMPLTNTFTITGAGLTAPITISAPAGSGITFSPTSVPANASNVQVTVITANVTDTTRANITLASGTTTNTIPYTFGLPANVYYNITETDRTLNIDAQGTVPVTVAAVANSATQAFKFIPVTGAANTYYIQNAAGQYLSKDPNSGWAVLFVTATNGTNSQWLVSGTVPTAITLQNVAIGGTNNYLNSQGGTTLWDNNGNVANGIFSLTALNSVTINYQDASGNTLKAPRFDTGVTIGATYTATADDMATFTTTGGVTYYYDASSTNSTVIVAGINSITLKFMGAPTIATSVSRVGFLSALTATFTVSGVNLNNDITLVAPAGITLSTYTVAKAAVNATVTVTAASSSAAGNITLTSGTLTKTVACQSGPVVGVWYNLIQLASGLPVGYITTGADSPGPGLITADVTAGSQYYSFVPVTGQTDTYTALNAEGNYLGNEGYWKSYFVSPTDATNFLPANTDLTISGDPYNSLQLKIASSAYLSTNAIVTNSSVYCDKAANSVNGAFKLVEAPTAILTTGTIAALSTLVGTPVTATITVAGSALQGNVTLAISGTDATQFSVSPATLTQTAGAVLPTVVTITYAPTVTVVSHVATLTISSTGATSKTFALSGSSAGTDVKQLSSLIKANVVNHNLTVTGADSYAVYNVQGVKIADVRNNTANTSVTLKSGLYFVKAAGNVQKVLVN